jgi:hypothetical protein
MRVNDEVDLEGGGRAEALGTMMCTGGYCGDSGWNRLGEVWLKEKEDESVC